jgi:hypothetical protein
MLYRHTINATQCLRTLASPKGRGGMLSGRLKYIIKKCFDFLSRTVKKLLAILCFLFLKIYDSARFNNMFQNSVLGYSLMSEELIEL